MTPTKLAAALALIALLAGCGSTTTDNGSPARAAAEPTAAPTREPVTTVKGANGDALTLQGSGLNPDVNDFTRTKVKVTLKGTKGPIKGFKISSKNKLIGVMLRFSNEGEQVYDDPLPNGTLKLAGGGTGKQASLIPLGGKNPCKNPTVKLKQGQSKNVCIAFEMPKGKQPASFEYITDAGYGDTGVWAL
jgi:hypothetical protein